MQTDSKMTVLCVGVYVSGRCSPENISNIALHICSMFWKFDLPGSTLKESVLLADLSELSVIEKKIIFLVDRISNKIGKSMKDDVIESLSDFGVRFLQAIKKGLFPDGIF